MERFKNVDAIGKTPNENNTYKYITMECKNDPTGGVPYWDPTYDHLIQPFPECVFLRKYFNEFIFLERKVSIQENFSIIMKANCFVMYLINNLLHSML